MSVNPGRPNPKTGIVSPEYVIGKGLFHPTNNRAMQTGTPNITGAGVSTSGGTTTINGLLSINGDKTSKQSIVGAGGVTVGTSGGVTTVTGSGGGGSGFPFTVVHQDMNYNTASTTSPLVLITSPTANNTLIAIVAYSVFSGATFTAPGGWTPIVKAEDATNGNAVGAWLKVSNGGETDFTGTDSRSDSWVCGYLELQGTRTVDKTASTTDHTASTTHWKYPSLTSPTAGAGVLCASSPSSSLADGYAFGGSQIGWDTLMGFGRQFHGLASLALRGVASSLSSYPTVAVPSPNGPSFAGISFSLL